MHNEASSTSSPSHSRAEEEEEEDEDKEASSNNVQASENAQKEAGAKRPTSPAPSEGVRSASSSVTSVSEDTRIHPRFAPTVGRELESLTMHRADGSALLIDKKRIHEIENKEDRAVADALWTMLRTAMRPSADTSAVSKASLPVWGKMLLNGVSLQFDYSVSIGTGDGKKVAMPNNVTNLGVFSADEGGFPHAIDSTHGQEEFRVYTSRAISVRARLVHKNGVSDYTEDKLLMEMEREFVKLTGYRPHSQLLSAIPYELDLVYADRDVQTGLHNRFHVGDLSKPELHRDLIDGPADPHIFVPADRKYYRMSLSDGKLGTAKRF